MDYRQSKTCSPANFFSGKIRVKNSLHGFLIHAVTSILYGEHNKGAWGHIAFNNIFLSNFLAIQADSEGSFFIFHGMIGIGAEVHHDLVHTCRICHN